MNKICVTCEISKSLEEFGKQSKNKDGLNSKCKSCKRIYDNIYHSNRSIQNKEKKYSQQIIRRLKARKYVNEYLKDKKCGTCSENRIPALDFHHLKDKLFNICDGVLKGYSLEKIKKEIAKCEVICANCHRIETAKAFNWYENIE